ncbi:MAG TPA: glycerophosphodiester phosphodiesterase family protein [Rhodanobacteraceae bacterium]
MQLIAHRGGSGLRVENTLAAFAHAIELGAAGAELDVHLSRDGEVIVHHDDTLNPAYCRRLDGDWITPDEALPLAELTFAQLQTYAIGTPRPGTDYARAFPRILPVADQRIPLLRDVIALAKARSDRFILVIEIKTPPLDAARQPWRALVDATLAIIDTEQFAARTIVCSFDWGALRHVKQQRPALATWYTSVPLSWFRDGTPPPADIPPDAAELLAWRHARAAGDAPWCAGFDPRHYGGDHTAAVAAAGGQAWFPFHRDFTPDTARELARFGLDSAVWSFNLRDPVEIARLDAAGADYLVTDYPDPGTHHG